MMRYQVITIFPELFEQFAKVGLVGRAVQSSQLEFRAINLRNFAVNEYGQVDDTPYGGGSGMVLRTEAAVAAIEFAKAHDPQAKVVLLTPRGRTFTRDVAREIIASCEKDHAGMVLLCARYEGVDERIAEHWTDYEVSLGDYVLMGGEVAAMALIEATSRLLPGIVGNPESIVDESFESGLLEYPQYTRPQLFRGVAVPELLLSGNHALIKRWREERAREDTGRRRPDLMKKAGLGVRQGLPGAEIDVALIHYPVMNKGGEIVTSSLTNLDLHDIARSARTFGLNRYYVVHPTKTLRRLGEKILEHWAVGYGASYNPNRGEALGTISIVPQFDDVLADIEARTGSLPKIVTTSARKSEQSVTFEELRKLMDEAQQPFLLLLGTGWGLAEEILQRADFHLEPIEGFTGYNHLSVRAAAAIIFDRLFGAP